MSPSSAAVTTRPIFSLGRVAKYLGVCERTARRWADPALPDPLPALKPNGGKLLFLPDQVDEWLSRQRIHPPTPIKRKLRAAR
jgi:hypothetical protein